MSVRVVGITDLIEISCCTSWLSLVKSTTFYTECHLLIPPTLSCQFYSFAGNKMFRGEGQQISCCALEKKGKMKKQIKQW